MAGLRGEIGGTAELLTTTLPALRAGIQAVAQELADAVNAAHGAGYDAAGARRTRFFAVDPRRPAARWCCSCTDPAALAASGVGGGPSRDGSNATAVAGALARPEQVYQRFVTSLGTDVASVRRLAATQAEPHRRRSTDPVSSCPGSTSTRRW